tara:strand:- start:6946 stop:7401 length:456 start_codon:yes stop_codon:yes gene_type:complete
MTDEINIRLGSLSDLNSIFNIEETVFLTESWSIKMIKLEFFKDLVSKSYVFELNGIVIGFAFTDILKYEVHLNRIAIDPNYQQNGFGFQLLKKILEENSINKSVFLDLKYSNISALKLYKKVGFKEYNIRKKYYLNNCDALLMCLKRKKLI